MFSWSTHPGTDQLLRFCDGELRPRDASRVSRHVETCWECRTHIEDLTRTIGEYVRYRNEVLKPALPPPPAPWPSLDRRFAEIRVEQKPRSFRWPLAAAAAVIVAIGFYVATNVRPVEAAELLRKAVQAEQNRPPSGAGRRIRFQTNKTSFTRASYVETTVETTNQPIELMFASAHYPWQDPLSADAFAQWRAQLGDKHDTVNRSSDMYEIRTTSSANDLAAATIFLSKADLHAVRERLEFRDQQWVELSEAPQEVKQPAPVRSSSAGPDDELNVIAALHTIGADLGDPVEVARSGNQVVVTGMLNEPRLGQLQDSLAGMANLSVRLSAPKVVAQQPDSHAVVVESAASLPALARQFPDSKSFLKFADSVLESSEALMARVHALRGLDERFPESVEAQMSAGARTRLASIREDHKRALTQNLSMIEQSMEPVLRGIPVRAEPAGEKSLFSAATRVDRLLVAILAPTRSNPVSETAFQDLANALRQLDQEVR